MIVYARWAMMVVLWLWAGLALAGTKYYYYTDAQGTVLAEADAQGNIVASYDYAPYGTQVLGTPPSGPAGYTGHVNDAESGLVYMQARYYDPAVGRFLSVDPLGVGSGDAFLFNRFAYSANNPINNYDPTGASCDSNQEGGSTECPPPPPPEPNPEQVPLSQEVVVTATASAGVRVAGELIIERLTIPRWLVAAPNPYVVLTFGLIYPGNMAACQEISCMPNMQISKGKKIPRPGISGKEGAKDVPSWARGERPNIGESGKDFADRLVGKNAKKGAGSDWNRIKKWGDRAFKDP